MIKLVEYLRLPYPFFRIIDTRTGETVRPGTPKQAIK